MPSPAQIARERERVRRAVDYLQRRLGIALDVKLNPECRYEAQIHARDWPREPKAFTLSFNPGIAATLSTHEIRELVLHELAHAIHWPVYETATCGMSTKAREAWEDTVLEPVIRELTRIVATHALGRWSQR